MRRPGSLAVVLVALLSAAGCSAILGIEDVSGDGLRNTGGAGGTNTGGAGVGGAGIGGAGIGGAGIGGAGAGGTDAGGMGGGAGGTGGSSSTTSSTTGSGGGGGSATSSTGGICAPGDTMSCYDGPAGTAGVGVCHAGTATCNPDGMSFGPCAGEVVPSAENCGTPDDDDCNGTPLCPGETAWAHGIGGANDDMQIAAAYGAFGKRFATAGVSNGGIANDGFSQTSGQAEVAVYDEAGNLAWKKVSSGATVASSNDVAFAPSGDLALVGWFKGALTLAGTTLSTADTAAFVARFNGAGALQGQKQLSASAGGDVRAHGVAVDASETLFVTGTFTQAMTVPGTPTLTSAGGRDGFLVAYDALGNAKWAKRFGGLGDEAPWGAAIAPNGDIVVTGYFAGAMSPGGTTLTSAGDFDVFVLRYGADGTFLWGKSFGGSGTEVVYRVAIAPNGDLLLSGRYTAPFTMGAIPLVPPANSDGGFVARLDGAGTPLWVDTFDGSWRGLGVAGDAAGNVFATGALRSTMHVGATTLTIAGGDDILVVKVGPDGTPIWGEAFGGAVDERGWAIATDGTGAPFVAGELEGTVDFAPGPVVGTLGAWDGFVAKLMP